MNIYAIVERLKYNAKSYLPNYRHAKILDSERETFSKQLSSFFLKLSAAILIKIIMEIQ